MEHSNTTAAKNITIALALTTLFSYILMIAGTFVTSTNSGLACPDWPLCYGTVAPPAELQVWFEWGHRLLGGVTGLLLLISTILIWKHYKGIPKILITTALVVLGVAVLMGGLIVRTEAPLLETFTHTIIISFHLLMSSIVITLLVFTFRHFYDKHFEEDKSKNFAILFSLIFAQVLMGILVRYSKGALACPDFPLCHGALIPDFTHFTVTLHFLHRLLALAIISTIIVLLIKTYKENKPVRDYVITLVLILTQITWGVKVVLSGMFLPYIILHGANGFLLLAWLAYKSMPYFINCFECKDCNKDIETENN